MSFSTCSAGALPGPDFCFIFAPGGYDEPEILPPQNPPVCLTGPDGEHALIERSHEFALVPWRPVLERARGQLVTGHVGRESISWSIGIKRGIGR
ncbi:DUF3363 domain-containing protein [Bradyrhizobium elkanii]|uniref:DUF3363 domain-containing protein n=1 Tax=Bradyrhizobium elkanii TaxID=29448 RepID=UPI00216928BF|nr:DUF3363 domain-containing protein [Bradyrhizobium elkanii]